MRVKVFAGDGKTFLDYGDLVDHVNVYFFETKSHVGPLVSFHNAEKKPGFLQTLIQKWLHGRDLITVPDNPKIILDSGKVVYGCQVWWEVV